MALWWVLVEWPLRLIEAWQAPLLTLAGSASCRARAGGAPQGVPAGFAGKFEWSQVLRAPWPIAMCVGQARVDRADQSKKGR